MDQDLMVPQQTRLSERANGGQKAKWIAGRVQTLLSHYFQPDTPGEVADAALDDWIKALLPFSQQEIEAACGSYIRGNSTRRPVPGDIRNRIEAVRKPQPDEDRTMALSRDEKDLLFNEIVPTCRRWIKKYPGLADHARKTLAHWGVPE